MQREWQRDQNQKQKEKNQIDASEKMNRIGWIIAVKVRKKKRRTSFAIFPYKTN